MDDVVIITRFNGMRDYLIDKGLADFNTPVYKHVPLDNLNVIRGKHVIGVLPLWLASIADRVTIVPLRYNDYHPNQFGLRLKDISKVAGTPVTYQVVELEPVQDPDVMVIRHSGMRDYLIKNGIATFDTPFFRNVSDPKEVEGKHVVGILPLWLAVKAEYVTVVPLEIPFDLRGVELNYDQVNKLAGSVATYKATVVE